MSGQGKRVLLYTASLLTAPLPLMPFEKGEREFGLALAACALVLTLGSFYLFRGELRGGMLGPLRAKLVAVSGITLLFGMVLLAGSVVYILVNL